MTLVPLTELAKKACVKDYSTKNKEPLVDALLQRKRVFTDEELAQMDQAKLPIPRNSGSEANLPDPQHVYKQYFSSVDKMDLLISCL